MPHILVSPRIQQLRPECFRRRERTTDFRPEIHADAVEQMAFFVRKLLGTFHSSITYPRGRACELRRSAALARSLIR